MGKARITTIVNSTPEEHSVGKYNWDDGDSFSLLNPTGKAWEEFLVVYTTFPSNTELKEMTVWMLSERLDNGRPMSEVVTQNNIRMTWPIRMTSVTITISEEN